MITVQKYDKERHLPLMKEWAKAWEYDYPWDYLPSHGWMAYSEDCVLDRNTPLGCMMVREAENQTAIVDLVLTPKEMTRGLVQEGLGRVFGEAEHWAKANGIKFILGMTLIPKIAEVASKLLGFKSWPTIALWRITNG